MRMEIGRLVRVKPDDNDIRGRTSGIVLKFDSHRGSDNKIINIAEVLWSDGPGWIAVNRIELLNN